MYNLFEVFWLSQALKEDGRISPRQCRHLLFPTDAKLYHKARTELVKIAQSNGIKLRQSYERKVKYSSKRISTWNWTFATPRHLTRLLHFENTHSYGIRTLKLNASLPTSLLFMLFRLMALPLPSHTSSLLINWLESINVKTSWLRPWLLKAFAMARQAEIIVTEWMWMYNWENYNLTE